MPKSGKNVHFCHFFRICIKKVNPGVRKFSNFSKLIAYCIFDDQLRYLGSLYDKSAYSIRKIPEKPARNDLLSSLREVQKYGTAGLAWGWTAHDEGKWTCIRIYKCCHLWLIHVWLVQKKSLYKAVWCLWLLLFPFTLWYHDWDNFYQYIFYYVHKPLPIHSYKEICLFLPIHSYKEICL